MSDLTTDALAQSILAALWEATDRQITREIAHFADIDADITDDGSHVAPEGMRMPDCGAITTKVTATVRGTEGVTESMRVAVWPTKSGDDPAFIVTLSGSQRQLPVALADVNPSISDSLKARINDFIASTIAHMVAELDVKMQRTYIRESTSDLAEYSEE